MRFLFVANFLRNENSGAAGHILQLVTDLNQKGHIAHSYFRDDLPVRIEKNLFLNTFIFLIFPLIAIFRILYLDFLNHYDFIVISSGDGCLYALFAKLVGRRRPIIIMRSHGYEALCKNEYLEELKYNRKEEAKFKERLFFLGFRIMQVRIFSLFCDSIFTLSNAEKEYLKRHYPNKDIRVIPAGVRGVFLEKHTQRLRVRDILFVGGWCILKGRHYLIDIITTLCDKKAYNISLIGTGVDEKQVLTDFPPGARSNIRAIKLLPKIMLKEEYDSHKVFLFPSLFEGFGKVVIEAMASGMAVVISEGLGVSEIILNGHNGYTVPKRDVTQFAYTVERLLKDENLREGVARNAEKTALGLRADYIADLFTRNCEELRRNQHG